VQRIAVRCVAVALVGMTVAWALSPPADEARWEPFEATAFRDMLGRQPVIVDFTADWCPNCKLLERTTLNAANMARWQKAYGARLVRVDLTRDDPVAQALLHSLGSSSIPVVALFPTGLLRNAPLVLRDLFTADQMDEALERAFGPAGQPLQP
jgi:thiol:disulfide interchange protein DsbD